MANGVQRINATLGGSRLFPRPRTDDSDRTLAQLPGLVAWWDGSRSSAPVGADGRMTETSRVNGHILQSKVGLAPAKTEAINGRQTLGFDGTQELEAPTFTVPAVRHTVMILHRLTGTGVRSLVGPAIADGDANDEPVLGILFSSGVARLVNEAVSSIVIGTTDVRNTVAITMATLSPEHGRALWLNGVVSTRNPALTAPLGYPSLSFGNFNEGGTGRYIGDIADRLLFEVDYSDPTYAAALATATAILKARGGIV